jgi:hypothetical protein
MTATARSTDEELASAASSRHLADEAQRHLELHTHFRGRTGNFRFEYDPVEQVLKIYGTVPSFYLKQLAQSVLKNLDGVARVLNHFVVA